MRELLNHLLTNLLLICVLIQLVAHKLFLLTTLILIGWVSGFGFAWVFVLQPFASWLLALYGIDATLPILHTDVLMELTLAMLGLAGLRSWEKHKGLTK